MRRIVLPLLFLTALAGYSRPLTPSEAYARCQEEMKMMRKVISSPSWETDLTYRTVAASTGEPGIYIFDTEDSFFIASADDVAIPVLAYGDNPLPSNENMPPAMREWLEFYANEIAMAAKHCQNAERTQLLSSAYSALASVSPLVSSSWNQSSPFNDKCPVRSGSEKCYTGCVATAAAQIMYKYKYPEHGYGTYSHADRIADKVHTWTVDFENTWYEWDKMTDKYTSKSSASAKDAVATLMQNLGVAFKMDYDYMGVNQSGTTLLNAATGLIRNLGYSKGIRYEQRMNYSADDWKQLVHSELSAGHPLLYEGSSASGHAFVCDGYDSKSDKFHFNWGWGGNGDGYYALSSLKPNVTSGIGGGAYNYTDNQAALFGIQPKNGDDYYYPLFRTYSYITVKNPVVNAGETMSVVVEDSEYNAFYNYVPTDDVCKFLTGLKLHSVSDGSTYVLSSPNVTELACLYGVREIHIMCDLSAIPTGEYIGRPVVKLCDESGSGTGDWEYVRVPEESISTLDVNVGKHFISAHNEATKTAMLTAEITSCPTSLNYEDEYNVEVEVKSHHADYSGAVVVAAYDNGSNQSISVGQSETLNIPAGKSVKVKIPCRLSKKMSDKIDLCMKYQSRVFAEVSDVRVDNTSGKLEFEVDDDWAQNIPPGENFSLGGELRTLGIPLTDKINCRIVNAQNEVCAEAIRGSYVDLKAGENYKLKFSFTGIDEEGTYYAELFYGNETFRVSEPIHIKDREFKVEMDYPAEVNENDYVISLNTTISLLSGRNYSGYLAYGLTGPNDYNKAGDFANYVNVEGENPAYTSFTIWVNELDFGDYLITLYLTDGPFGELLKPIAAPFPLRKIDMSGFSSTELTPMPNVIVDSNGKLTVQNVSAGTNIKIFSTGGMMLQQFTATIAGDYVIHNQLQPGIYLVKVDNRMFKIML